MTPWPIRMLLLLTIPALILHVYAALKLSNSIGTFLGCSRTRVRRVMFIIHGYVILYPVLSFLGYFLEPDFVIRAIRGEYLAMDLLFAYPFWIGLITVLQISPFLVISDLVKLSFLQFYRSDKERWLALQAKILMSAAVLSLGYVVIRVVDDTHRVRVSSRNQIIRGLPDAMRDFRIVHISDLQMDPRTRPAKVNRYIDAVNRLKPDLVCFSGDLITWGREYIDSAAAALGRIESAYGVHAVYGDHDYWSGPAQVESALAKTGVRVLQDENFVVDVEGGTVLISAVTNIYQRRPRAEALQMIAAAQDTHRVSIFLTHQPSPSLVRLAEEIGYDIFLGGHTHGGQVRLGYGKLTWSFSSIETPFVSGFSEIGSTMVSVNNGLGLTFAPVRFQAPAEVTLITLTQEKARGSHDSTN